MLKIFVSVSTKLFHQENMDNKNHSLGNAILEHCSLNSVL